MTVTIRDVAKKAGVSITTVSRALNGYDDVNEATREKIAQIAQELNYQPNRVAQNLVAKRAKTFGLFVLERRTLFHPFVFEVISGLADHATQEDFDLLLFGTKSLKPGNLPSQICLQRGVSGAVIMGLRTNDPILQLIQESNFPTVLIDIPIQGPKATFVGSDNQLGSRQAVSYLVSLGHQKIGFVNGHDEAWVSIERLHGYRDGLKEAGLTFDESYVFHGNFSLESGKIGARTLIEQHPDITAIYAASDWMARGVIEELKEMGMQVPQDIAVVGFDDLEFAAHMSPALTTIRQNKYAIGTEAAKKLFHMISDEQYIPEPRFLETELIIRESTGPVK